MLVGADFLKNLVLYPLDAHFGISLRREGNKSTIALGILSRWHDSMRGCTQPVGGQSGLFNAKYQIHAKN